MSGARSRDLALRAWARGLVDQEPGMAPIDLVASVVHMVGRSTGLDVAADEHVRRASAELDPSPPGGWANPWLPGIVHEQAVSAEDRSARGAWYTPRSVVDGLAALAMGRVSDPVPGFIADPTCGGGAFLLAALDHLVALGLSAEDALARIGGMDIDPGAVTVSGWSVRLWAAMHDVSIDIEALGLLVGDALDGHPPQWPAQRLILGNPPFATPLRKVPVPAPVTAFRTSHQDLLGPYTDLAALHLLAAVESSGPGSAVALVQPQSVLSGRDTAVLRAHFDRTAPLQALWAAREPVFDAGVRACAVVLGVGGEPPERVTLTAGAEVSHAGTLSQAERRDGGTEWSVLAARALGAPVLPPMNNGAAVQNGRVGATGTLGDLVTATAGFRDEYYGLVDACREAGPGMESGMESGLAEPNRLLTVGAVEPLATLWGIEPSKFGRKQWQRPVIEMEALNARVLSWTERQLVPKVVLATQSRILEPVIDRSGSLIPATPLLAVHASPEDLNRVAAVLLAPPVVAWAWQRWFGAAMAVDALKLAAKQVSELPTPADVGAWDEAALAVGAIGGGAIGGGAIDGGDPALAWQQACVVARLMNRAYGAEPEVFEWWLTRSRRPAPTGQAPPPGE